MVQIDVPVAFAIGSVFADAAYKQLQTRKPKYYYKTFFKSIMFQIFFFSWIPVYFLINNFGWETTHMWWHADSVWAYPFFIPIFMVVFFLAASFGFMFGNWFVKKGYIAINRAVYILIALYSLVWIFTQTGSTFRLGTYAQWKAGTAPLFYEDKTFLFMLIFTLIIWAAALLICYFRLHREGKHLDTEGEF